MAWHNAMVRMGDWKLVNNSGFGHELPPGENPRMKLELYNLAEDPYEERDLAEASAVEALAGETAIRGHLPITLSTQFPVGHGLHRSQVN